MKYEVILSAYNDADVLLVTLTGYLNQTDKDFCICIADDGSGPEVKAVADDFKERGLNIRHVWHEDNGFRKTIILNKAIASSSADRIIFSDGDSIPNENFIADHKAMYKPSTVVTGPRVYLREKLTEELKQKIKQPGYLHNTYRLLYLSLFNTVSRAERALRFPDVMLPLLRKLKDVWPYGANLAVDRIDLLEINGFDEDYLGWGGEDIDLHQRLKMAGLDYIGVIGRAVSYHLEHPIREPDDGDEELKRIKEEKEKNRVKFARNGLSKWL